MDLLQDLPISFKPVPVAEMAFALTYFVHAADQKIGAESRSDERLLTINESCERLFHAFLDMVPDLSTPGEDTRVRSDQAGLPAAFRALCRHYHHSEHNVSLCARVLAFYLLMEQSAGSVLEGHLHPEPETERHVLLDAVVVEALASIPLGPSVLLSPLEFRNWLATRVSHNFKKASSEEQISQKPREIPSYAGTCSLLLSSSVHQRRQDYHGTVHRFSTLV